MTKRDEWIRVRSESELRAGMALESRPCFQCGRTERTILVRICGSSPCGDCGGAVTLDVYQVGTCNAGIRCLRSSIHEGRLYRLSDSQLTEDETTRELERVR